MDLLKFALKKLIGGIPLILGVTLVSFLLMVYFGPDLTYEQLGKNPTAEEIAQVRETLGYNQPFIVRYGQYLMELITLDFGFSMVKDQPVSHMLAQSIPVSLQLTLPGFILGNLLAVILALWATAHRGQWIDKTIMTGAVIGMSVSFLVVIIAFQIMLSSRYGMNLFPVRGWNIYSADGTFSWWQYLQFVTVPTLATVFVALGYNTRFYRAVLVEEINKDHVRTARAFGHSQKHIMYKAVLKNAMVPIITRVMFSIPLVVVSGSLLIESYFGIPGVGQVTYDAIIAGDQPILKAVVGLTAALFVVILLLTDILYRAFDPRVELK
ncbi:ABC transporter permease [Marinicella rhabdoformis]|uniref:ABC transporter permease n=1 Tax=Marinicella rhabdoformis TaxID=2580566 RepID=UPI0012AEC6C0|nr:ABC transporter permease [Marinicella rhabdoformis]